HAPELGLDAESALSSYTGAKADRWIAAPGGSAAAASLRVPMPWMEPPLMARASTRGRCGSIVMMSPRTRVGCVNVTTSARYTALSRSDSGIDQVARLRVRTLVRGSEFLCESPVPHPDIIRGVQPSPSGTSKAPHLRRDGINIPGIRPYDVAARLPDILL